MPPFYRRPKQAGGDRSVRSVVDYLNRAEVAERQTRYVQGVVSISSCGFKSHLRHHALVAQRIERSPAEAEAVGSSPTQRAILPPEDPQPGVFHFDPRAHSSWQSTTA